MWLRRTMRVSAVRRRAIEKAQPATHKLSGCRKEGRGMDDRSLLLEDVKNRTLPNTR